MSTRRASPRGMSAWKRVATRLPGRNERGTAVVEFSWLAVLLLVPLVYSMVAVFDVQRTAYGAAVGARAAARAFVIVPDGISEEVARERAFEAARVAMKDQGVELKPAEVKIGCRPVCLEPGSTVTVEIGTEVRLPFLPEVAAVQVSASHTEPFGDYREAKGDG